MATFAFIMLPSSTALWVMIFCSSECCDGDGGDYDDNVSHAYKLSALWEKSCFYWKWE